MKPTTDPDTGKTTCELSTQDRKTLAAAKTLIEKIGYHYRDTRFGGDLIDNASLLEEILEDIDAAANRSLPEEAKPPAEKKPETTAK